MKRFDTATVEFEGNLLTSKVLIDDEDAQLSAWDGTELDVVGRPTARLDATRRVSGRARYTVDIVLPRMLHAAILRSPLANARVARLDLDAARAVAGVRAVLGPEDAVGTLPSSLTREPPFAGAPIAAVAAETAETLGRAVQALDLDLEPAPFTVDIAEARRAGRYAKEPVEYFRGDPVVLDSADVTVELELETPYQVHAPLEPHAAVADWQDDELTVWLSTQAMFQARDGLAARFAVPASRVRVISEYVGGGFGCKLQLGDEACLAVELSRRTGRPVKLVFSRHEEQLVGGHRCATRQSLRLGARRDGTLVGIELDATVGMGMAAKPKLVPVVGAPATALYLCENVRTSVHPVQANLSPFCSARGGGVTEGTTLFEQAMDELAKALDLDPLELRRRVHVDHDQRTGRPYSAKRLLACYERAAARAGWAERDRLRAPQSDGLLRGMGCASQFWWGRGAPPAHCTIRMGSDGVATVTTGIQEVGTGTTTAVRLIAAEELGLPPESIWVAAGDTRPNLYAPAAGGSGTTGSVMPAVRAAAARVRRTLLELAAEMFEASPEDLDLRGGRIRSLDRALDRPYTEVTDALGQSTIDGAGSRGPNDESYLVHSWGCQIAQVAVDCGLGNVVVERIWAVHDVGRIINPLTASGQVEGGILQGIGFALSEERILDPTTGAAVNASMAEYKVPTLADAPEIVIEFIDEPDPIATNTGAIGLGEPPVIPTAAAVANAFAHATGRRCRAIPLTPERVLEALA